VFELLDRVASVMMRRKRRRKFVMFFFLQVRLFCFTKNADDGKIVFEPSNRISSDMVDNETLDSEKYNFDVRVVRLI
jgi:hypothetical protein